MLEIWLFLSETGAKAVVAVAKQADASAYFEKVFMIVFICMIVIE